jgi:hypothetical protein
MGGPTILVINHIYNRQMSYISGVMTFRYTVNGVSLGEKLSKLTVNSLSAKSVLAGEKLIATYSIST